MEAALAGGLNWRNRLTDRWIGRRSSTEDQHAYAEGFEGEGEFGGGFIPTL